MSDNRIFCDSLEEEGIALGSAALANRPGLQRVLFMPADTDAARTGAEIEDTTTMVIHCRDLIWPNWHMITRDIGLGDVDLNEHSLLNMMLEIERGKTQETAR